MIEEIQFLNDIIIEFLIFIVLGAVAVIGGIMKSKYKSGGEKQEQMQDCLNTQNARGIRQSEALIDIAEHMDYETKRLHGNKEPLNPIKSRINRNLRDEDGNL